jgi:hypothetical protein
MNAAAGGEQRVADARPRERGMETGGLLTQHACPERSTGRSLGASVSSDRSTWPHWLGPRLA